MPYDPYAEDEDYYTLANPAFAGDRFSPYSEGAIAFDEPSRGGVRYPVAAPASGGQVGTLGAFTPDWQRVIDEMVARDKPAADRQYQNELARAERNDIADAGPDPKAIEAAIQYQGVRMFQQLVADGASPAEASRLAAPKLYYRHPQAMSYAMRGDDIPTVPSISTVPVGNRQALFVDGKYRTTVPVPVTKDPIRDLESKEASEAVTQAMRALSLAQKPTLGGFAPPDPKLIAEAERNLELAREGRRNVIRGKVPAPPAEDVKETPDEIRSLYKSGKLSRAEAEKKLKALGFK